MLTAADQRRIDKIKVQLEQDLQELRRAVRHGWVSKEDAEARSSQLINWSEERIQEVRDSRRESERKEWLKKTHERLDVFNMVATGCETVDEEMIERFGPTKALAQIMVRKGGKVRLKF